MVNKKNGPETIQPKTIRQAKSLIDELAAQAQVQVDTHPERALQLAEQAISACKSPPFDQKSYQKGLAAGCYACASAYLAMSDYGKSLKFFSESLAIYQKLKNTHQIASQLNNIGIVYAFCGEYDQALEHMRAAESFLDDSSSKDFKAEVFNNIGYTYVTLGDYPNAVPYLLKSLETAESIEDSGNPRVLAAKANVLDSLCQAYLAVNNLEEALVAGIKSVENCRQNGELRKQAEYLLSLGEVYLRLGGLQQAEKCYQDSLLLAREHGFRREESDALRRLGNLHAVQKNPLLAAEELVKALSIAEEINIRREIYECHSALSKVHKQSADFEKALHHYEQFHKVKEEVFNDQSDQRIKNLEMIHQVEQAHRESEIHRQKSMELQKEIEERRKAQELAENLARTDSLTGVLNRGYFFTLTQYHILESIRKKMSFSIIIGDIDHFKRVNDEYGHLEGDRVLVSIASTLGAALRKDDLIGRYGGEEFVIMLPSTSLEMALVVAERLRLAVETLQIACGQKHIKVTISMGVSSLKIVENGDSPGLERLLYEADQALYEAKRQGRNKVMASSQ